MRAQFELPVGLLATQSGASSSSSSSHVRGHLPTADGERAHAGYMRAAVQEITRSGDTITFHLALV